MVALGGLRHPEDYAMLETIPYPRELIAERVVFTPADHAQMDQRAHLHRNIR